MSLPIREAGLGALVRDALERAGEAEVEVYARAVHRGFARFAIGELGQHMELDEPSIHVRVARGRRVAEASASRLDEEAIVTAIRRAAQAAERVPESEHFPGFAGSDEPAGVRPPRFAEATASSTAEARVEALAPVLDAVRGAGLVPAGFLDATATLECVATTRGLLRTHAATIASFRVWALETPGAGGASGFGHACHRDVTRLPLEEETERAIRLCRASRDPVALDAGAYDVVLEAPAVAELVEWLGATAFGAREYDQGTSLLSGRLGERVTGEAFGVVEDPLDASDVGFGSPFDREGTWRARVPLIERGVAKGVLYDRTWASRLGARSTGSAAPPATGETGPMPCAPHVAPGEAASVEELLGGVRRGLYVCRLHYVNGLLEPRRAVMTGLTRDGTFLVENGKIARAVGNLRFTDSMSEAFARMDGATRRTWAVPTWWTEGGAVIAPAVRVRKLVFTGRSQERLQVG